MKIYRKGAHRNNDTQKGKISGSGIALSVLFTGLVVGLVFFTGCNNGSHGTGGETGGLSEGVFVDAPVEGLDYHTETGSGTTDAEGTFHYQPGQTVHFSIGDMPIGESTGEAVMTPVHLADGAAETEGIDHPVVTNMARFMQSLDADADPENGITITGEVRDEVSGRMIDFDQSVEAFENDADVQAMFDTMEALDIPHNGQPWQLCSVDQARTHMQEHMMPYMEGMGGKMGGNMMGGSNADDDSGASSDTGGGSASGGNMMQMDPGAHM